MIAFAELHKKIERLYSKVLSAHVEQQHIFPLIIAADKSLPDDFAAWTKALEEIISHSADRMDYGYIIDYETKQTRRHGVQSVPVQFRFDNSAQLLGYLGKQSEFEWFSADVASIVHVFPILKNWLACNAKLVVEYHASWKGLLQVLEYFAANHKPQLFARELPIAVHTKFIEQHKSLLYALLNEVMPEAAMNHDYAGVSQFEQRFGLRLAPQRIRMRILDAAFAKAWCGGFTDLELTVDELATANFPLERAIVLENKKSFENADIFLSLPPMHGTAVFFGSGKAVSLLASLPWLQNIPLWYWGDMDAEGFEILHLLRQSFPQASPVCMDATTYAAHEHYVTSGSGAKAKALPLLNTEEQALYETLCDKNLRLEQERINHAWVLKMLTEKLREAV